MQLQPDIQNSHHVTCEYTLRRATTVRERESVRTTGGQGGSARPSPPGPESTARPGSAHPKSLASSPLHNGCSPETGLRACTRSGSARGARRRGNDRGSVGTTAGRRAAPVVLKTATSERPMRVGSARVSMWVHGSRRVIEFEPGGGHAPCDAGSDRPRRCCRSRTSR